MKGLKDEADALIAPLRLCRCGEARRVLATRGNCSSATILLVLEQILANSSGQRTARVGDIGVLMAFGPGLTMESAVVRL